MAHFSERLCFDLSDALAGDLELTAYFFKRAAVAIHQAKALFKNLSFAFGQRVEDILDLILEQNDRRLVGRIFSSLVLDEITEAGVVGVADWSLE